MTHKANGVPCRFDLYWRIVFAKTHLCRVLKGRSLRARICERVFWPCQNRPLRRPSSARNCVEFLWLTRDSETKPDYALETSIGKS